MGLVLKNRDGSPSYLSNVIDQLILRCTRETPRKDAVSAITGYNGSGKSTFGWEMCREIGKRLFAQGLSSEPWNCMADAVWRKDKEEMRSKFYAKKYSPFLIDEMLAIASKHKWQTPIAQYAEDLYLTNRTQQRPSFLIGTRMTDFTENFRNQRILFDFKVLRTGFGVLMVRHTDSSVGDPWFIKSLEKDITEQNKDKHEAQEFLFGGDKLSFYQNRINYVCPFYFSALSKAEQAVYDKLREKIEQENIAIQPRSTAEKIVVMEKRLGNLAQNLVVQGKSIEEIAKMMGTTTNAVNATLKKTLAADAAKPAEIPAAKV